MNRIHTILRSGPTRKVALAGMALLATVYTVPRVGSDLSSVQTVLTGITPAVADSSTSSTSWDLPNIDNARVDSWVKLFTTDQKVKSRFAVWLDRKSTYEPMISEKLAERDMPQDLIYLAMIESGFNPKAQSPAKAGGLWQFISETGRRYGLTVNKHVDERNHPEKATDAALSYLSDLHDRFGSWYLAAAAYNTGENRVARIMKQVTGSEKGTDEDYYRISKLLPKETQDYVPMMIAAGRISKEPAKYGFDSELAMAE
ncbi:MAG TPA: lytic transglycosylase domain-containing protein [Gemmatimonadaceae bacterium]|jgi:membrane-bound lytic murein transglycosylase D|nr:lytic transglycosylase domain-containing protein [Gemmatimonadaceae bacterium]